MGCPHIDRRHCCIKPHGGPPLQWLHWELPWRLAQADFLLEGKKRCQVGTNLQNQQFPITPDFSNLGISNSLYTQTAIVYILYFPRTWTQMLRILFWNSFPLPTFQISHFFSTRETPSNFIHSGKKKSLPGSSFCEDSLPPSHLEKQNFQKICLRHAILPHVLLVWRWRFANDFSLFLRIRLWSLAL